jgi:hypothetical protein
MPANAGLQSIKLPGTIREIGCFVQSDAALLPGLAAYSRG